MIALRKAGRSAGVRLVIRLPSRTTARSTQFAPALTRSSLIEWNEVAVRPRSTSAETSIQPAWQIAATTLPCWNASRTSWTIAG